MAEVIIMPKLGFNMNEGKLVKWYKKEGESVQKGENLFSIETDKTNMDIEATGDGVVRKLFINEGDVLPVTLPIAIVGDALENIDELAAIAWSKLGQETKVSVKEGDAAYSEGHKLKITPRARRAAAEMGISLEGLSIEGTGFAGGVCNQDIWTHAASLLAEGKTKTTSTPLARNLAAAEGIDLAGISGTGVNGRVRKKDVKEVLSGAAAIGPRSGSGLAITEECREANYAPDGKEILEEIPYAGVRKIIGERLSESKISAPHVYFTQRVDLEKLLALQKDVNTVQVQKISVTDFISRAVVLTLQKYSDMNASLIGDVIIKYRTVNLGVAVASPGGLIVPTIKNAEKMKITELSKVRSALTQKAREGRLTPDEYNGGTFTISNLGMFGIENFTAIINPPEVGILAVSAAKDKTVVVVKEDGTKKIAIRPMMNIQLSVDHRVIDGVLAAQFVSDIKKLLEEPIELFL